MKRTVGAIVALLVIALAASARDFSDLDTPVTASYAEGAVEFGGKLQVIAYNIERGFFWPDVAAYIKEQVEKNPATVALLSECDRNHSRTGDVFVADELARSLKMHLVYVTEFVEYNDNTPVNQGDHGNAILSPFPLEDVTVIRHVVVRDWEKSGAAEGEPRRGNRVSIGATVVLPDGRKVRVYTCHLESHAGSLGKWKQIKEVIYDVDKWDLPAVIGGDFNELPGMCMFQKFPRYGIGNAFAGDRSGTGSCRVKNGGLRCPLKIDWIVYKGLELSDRSVDHPLNYKGNIISDHAPVRAVFDLKQD